MRKKLLYILLLLTAKTINCQIFEFPKINWLDQQPKISSQRLSSHPYMSGDTFRSFCDFIIDKSNQTLDTDKIKAGDVIYIEAQPQLLDFFFSTVHPQIKTKYILMTHNSDLSEFGKYSKYLDEEKIVAWFGQNMTLEHKKAFPLPIGLANRYWRHGDIHIVNDQVKNLPKKDTLIYVNISMTTPIRRPIYEYFSRQNFCSMASNRDFKNFINDMARSTFVVSPPGNGIDCHRTWEALYLGAIPLVGASTLNRIFEDLPVIIVDDWKTVTKEFLINKYEEMKNKKYNMEKIYADYWFRKINEFKEIANFYKK